MKLPLILAFLFLSLAASAQWQGKVVRVIDGDTYEVKKGNGNGKGLRD
jgi:endonuclease YncB( thermonuclease family)